MILACFVSNLNFAQDEIELKNSNLEGVDKNGNFFWWKHQAKDGGNGVFSVENSDLINGSKKALKAEIKSLASKGWLVSSQFNQKFKGKSGEVVKVTFFAKKNGTGKGKLKLVLQSEVKGSFQGKDFFLTDNWQSYSHDFKVYSKSNSNQIKFWCLEAGTTYLIDDLKILKL